MDTVNLNNTRLTKYIIRSNQSFAEFANRAGISASYLALLLAGRCNPSGKTRAKLLEATGLTFDELFSIVGGGIGSEDDHDHAHIG